MNRCPDDCDRLHVTLATGALAAVERDRSREWASQWKKAAKDYRASWERWFDRARRAEHMLELVTKERDWAFAEVARLQEIEFRMKGLEK